jgi:hypothetical protein
VKIVDERNPSALLGALFGLAFHPIKNRMEHALRRPSCAATGLMPSELSLQP